MTNIRKLIRGEEGVTAVEYALIAALIAVVIIIAVQALGVDVRTVFETVSNAINPAPAGP